MNGIKDMNSKPFKEFSRYLSFDPNSQELLAELNNKKIRPFHLISRAIFKEIAKELGITEYKIRGQKRNYFEPVEMYFHSEHLYIHFEYEPEGRIDLFKKEFMFRYVRNIDDYIGGCNSWMSYKFLCENPEKAAEYFKLALDNPKIPVILGF